MELVLTGLGGLNIAILKCWEEVFEVMKGKDPHPRLLYPAKLSFRMEGQIKCFPDNVKLKEFIITKLLLYEMLKGLTSEKEDDQNYEQ